jgi:CRISPR-associated endonuclease/helicase Cas3
MAELLPADFGEYFKAIHEHEPFPWQTRLLEHVVREGRWPELLDLPTGSGKTAVIDIALFSLALDASRPPDERSVPRRIVMVVDRRTVVDQGFERASTIATALRDAKDPILVEVARRLRSVGRHPDAPIVDDDPLAIDEPLSIAQLRGGMPRDDAWAHRPDQALIAISTVDQVGSRLLFRGYGVSEAMRSIHAGLLGNDVLLVLDEVHLSQPFRDTLQSIRQYRKKHQERTKSPLGECRFHVVAMSATPGEKGASFGLGEEDHKDARLAKRLLASKPIELAEVKVAGKEEAKLAAFAEECAQRASAWALPGRTVGVIVNRVATARAVFAEVRRILANHAEVFLVTGRMRPLDRADLEEEIVPKLRSGRKRNPSGLPVVVVSTQCIEAGADFDFDALVTECASLDALRQRFGRLNRLGDVQDAKGVVLIRSDTLSKDEDDPIYGGALIKTWRWLEQEPRRLDFGVEAMGTLLPVGDDLQQLLPPASEAPVLLPAHLDAWVQTKPRPRPDPDVSLWLHGKDRMQDADVQVVWRADLTGALLDRAAGDKAIEESLMTRVAACPPVGLEALSVPIWAVRSWLSSRPSRDLADVEGRSLGMDDDREPAGTKARRAILWKGADERNSIIDPEAKDLPPGATIVVPSAYGGIADRNWDPTSRTAVTDLGDRARFEQTGRPTLRLHGDVLGSWEGVPAPVDEEDQEDPRVAIGAWLASESASTTAPEWRRQAAKVLSRKRAMALVTLDAIVPIEGGDPDSQAPAYFAVVGRFRSKDAGASRKKVKDRRDDATTDGDGASYTGVGVPLREHLAGVGNWAERFATRCLPDVLARDVVLAARLHDAGKADPRFQRMLHGGDAARAETAPEPLAKSPIVETDRAKRARAYDLSGYPRGGRHELASIALMEANAPLVAEARDRDLVLHLVASHHGWCRPFAPAVIDPEPVEITFKANGADYRVRSDHQLDRLDNGVPERFWRLVEHYGWFGLAWMEAVLRLADHRRSEQEQQQASEKGGA